MSDNEISPSVAVDPDPSTGISPIMSDLHMDDDQLEVDSNKVEPALPSKDDPASNRNPIPDPLKPAATTSAHPAPRKPAPTKEEATAIMKEMGHALDDDISARVALPYPKHLIHLPSGFISLALRIAELLQSLKPNATSHGGKDFKKLLLQAVALLSSNDTTRLEAAMLTLHSLSLVADSGKASHIAAWGEQFLLWSEENQVLMREALDLFETMCQPGCKPLTLWYFKHALSRKPMVPFSALLGRYTPAHVRKSVEGLKTVLTALKDHGKPMSCKEFQKEARKIAKPRPVRERESTSQTSALRKEVMRESRKVAAAVAVVAETMGDDDQASFLSKLEILRKVPSLDDAVEFLLPLQKRRRVN